MTTRTQRCSLLLLSAVLLWGGCGGPDASTAAPADAPAPAGVRVVSLTADDTMKFSLTELRAQPGEKLRVVLHNTGRMPKQAMAHNWVLLSPRPDEAVMSFGMAAATAAPDYLPKDRSGILAHTPLLGPGESGTADFSAPTAPGRYPFLCTFPGHVALMKGALVVE